MVKMVCVLAAVAALAASSADAKVKIEAMTHNIQLIDGRKFDSVVGKFRDSSVSLMWFYNAANSADEAFLAEYDSVATELKGMVKVTAVNCEEDAAFCKKHQVTDTPHVHVFPPNPMPDHRYKGELTLKKISSYVTRQIPSLVTILTKENIDTWLSAEPTKPKMLVFSTKNNVPAKVRALSTETVFKRTVRFGMVGASETELVKRFAPKTVPTILKVQGAKKEWLPKGSAFTYQALQEWVNLHSESGMGDKVYSASQQDDDASVEESMPWLVEEVPQLHALSNKDICFKGDGLCVIYLKNGALDGGETEMLKALKQSFVSQMSGRGAVFKWMWMDLNEETKFAELFQIEKLPGAVVFNPHKRLRFTKMEDDTASKESITQLLEKVSGGDARFKPVPGQKLPQWASRVKPGKDDKKAGKKEL